MNHVQLLWGQLCFATLSYWIVGHRGFLSAQELTAIAITRGSSTLGGRPSRQTVVAVLWWHHVTSTAAKMILKNGFLTLKLEVFGIDIFNSHPVFDGRLFTLPFGPSEKNPSCKNFGLVSSHGWHRTDSWMNSCCGRPSTDTEERGQCREVPQQWGNRGFGILFCVFDSTCACWIVQLASLILSFILL